MPSIYQLKPGFQRLLRPLARGLVRAGVTPNQVTLAGVALSIGAGAVVAWQPTERWPLLLLPATLVVRMALNALDGMMAREHGLATPLGALLNELGDVVADAALYLPLAWVAAFPAAGVVAAVVLAGLSELAGVAAVQVGATRRYDGPMGKSDRAFVFGALGLGLGLGLHPGRWVDAVVWVVVALLAVTVANRARAALREVRGSGGPTAATPVARPRAAGESP
jgi:CDP-diacylglycerol---glycerol-3-phosphate 3-phosphatidyltransferase